jgi:putative lipoic acid-binding regulatory protein
MAQQEPPKIEYPCENYPIKIMGETSAEFFDFVLVTTEIFAPNFDRKKVLLKESGKGRFTSVTVFITVTGVEQLEQYHQALKKNAATKVVL